MLTQKLVQRSDFIGWRKVDESEEDYARMGLTLPKHQLAEISVIGDQDSAFSLGDGENLFVFDARLVVNGDSRNVVSLLSEKGG